MTSISFNIIGLIRPGFENCEVQVRTSDLRILRSSRTGDVRSTHSATDWLIGGACGCDVLRRHQAIRARPQVSCQSWGTATKVLVCTTEVYSERVAALSCPLEVISEALDGSQAAFAGVA